MFRLKSLPNNSTPESLTNPTDTAVPVSALTPAYPLHLSSSPATFIAAQPSRFTHMITAGAVFYNPQHRSLNNSQERESRTLSPALAHNRDQTSAGQNLTQHKHHHSPLPTSIQQEPYLLLVQRASNDTFPLHWELPGGTVDPTDKTLFEAVAREVGEETGLVVKEVKGQVLPVEVFNTGWNRRMKKWIKVTFLVEVEHAVFFGSGLGGVGGGEGFAGGALHCGDVEGRGSDNGVVTSGKGDAHEGVTGEGAKTLQMTPTDANPDNEADETAKQVTAISLSRTAELEHQANISAVSSSSSSPFSPSPSSFTNPSSPPPITLNKSEHQAHLWVTEAEIRAREIKGMELLFICDEQVQILLGAFELYRQVYEGVGCDGKSTRRAMREVRMGGL